MSFRSEFAKIKNESLKVKLDYIFSYYWIPMLIALLLIFTLIPEIIYLATQKETVLSGHCIDAVFELEDSEQFIKDVSSKLGIDESKEEFALTTSLLITEDLEGVIATHQLISAQITSRSLDFLSGDPKVLLQYAYDACFYDLRTVLSAEQSAALSPYFLYIDETFERVVEPGAQPADFPDPTKPEEMEKPVPFAVQIPESSDFDRVYFGDTDELSAIAIIRNAPNTTAAIEFLFLTCTQVD